MQFLDGIADMNFTMENPGQKPANISELVAWYDKNFKSASASVAAMTAEQLITPLNFMGVFNFPSVVYLGFVNNHGSPSRGTSHLSSPHGIEGPKIYGGSFDEPMKMPEPATTAA